MRSPRPSACCSENGGPHEHGREPRNGGAPVLKSNLATVLQMEMRRSAGMKSAADMDKFKKFFSPITYVDNAPPLLLIFSNPDTLIPAAQPYEMMDALKKAGKTFEFHEATGKYNNKPIDHGFASDQDNTPQAREARKKALGFFDRYLKNK